MIFSHLPAGFVATYSANKLMKTKLTRKQTFWLFIFGLVGSIFPDFDLLYVYIFNAQNSHRELVTHTPLPYIVIIILSLIAGFVLKNKLVKIFGVMFGVSALIHLLFDMTTSGIAIFYPWSEKLYGLLMIETLSEGWYGKYLVAINFTIEILIFILFFNIILWFKFKRRTSKIILGVVSIISVVLFSLSLFWANQKLPPKNGLMFYGDVDNDNVINMRDEDMDGDGIENILDNDANGDGRDNDTDAKEIMKDHIGIWHDPFEEGMWELTSRIGMLSSLDIIYGPYNEAGVYLHDEMKRDYEKNPDGYINSPNDSNFRTNYQNIYNFFDNNNLFHEVDSYETGDIIFVGENNKARQAYIVFDENYVISKKGNIIDKIDIDEINNIIATGRIF